MEAGARLGHYRIVEKIGAGGMGEVYRADDLKLERPVAIKILPAWAAGDRVAVERLVREAKLASALNHPHIVTMYAIEESDPAPFLVMEYVEGETLRARLHRSPLELPELIAVGSEVADALDAAHRVGLIHRDVKSTNILITGDGHAKVVDFGLAKRLPGSRMDPDATAGVSLTATGAVVGTAAYMSPEQTRGEPLDPRTDLFSLGVVLYEAATGRLPFEGPTMLSVLHEIALVEPPAPSRARPGLPRELDQVLLRAMAKDKERRYASAAEFGAALRGLGRERGDPVTGDKAGADPGSSSRVPNNLPAQLTSFVGRRDEMEEVGRLLGTARLVTLTGAGGCGKSRLSFQVARNLLESYPDGAWLVELAPLSDPGLVPQRVAAVLGVREESGRPPVETLRDWIGSRALLVLLDNCEHLTAACRDLAAQLIRGCPGLRVLATSREALGTAGEVLWHVPPLHVPDLRGHARLTRREIGQFESVRLFVERAAAATPAFAVTEENAKTVAQICARLDGIPLAIELAAARIKVLPVGQILARIEDRFRLLTTGSHAALPHQQTLRATVDWSYDLLAAKERTLFDRLSVFAGGATLEGIEAVCSGDGFEESEILDLVTHLADKSLLIPEEGAGGTARYRLLETLREYGKEKLEASGAFPRLSGAHAEHFAAIAERAEPELRGPDQSRWLERLEEEHDNLRLAMDRLESAPLALHMAASLWRFWWVHGHFSEGRRRLASALARSEEADRRDRAKALRGAAALARGQSDFVSARAYVEESLAIERSDGDGEGIAASLHELGNLDDNQGDRESARRHFEEGLRIRRELGDRRGVSGLLHNLGILAQTQRDYERARALISESLAINRELGNRAWEATALNALGSVAFDEGDQVSARRFQEQGLAIHEELHDPWGTAFTLRELGKIAIEERDEQTASTKLRESILAFQEMGAREEVAETLEHFSVLEAERRNDEAALVLAAAASGLRDALGSPATAPDQSRLEARLAGPRERLGPERVARAWSRGSAMSLQESVRFATSER
jgi:predicted ATPase